MEDFFIAVGVARFASRILLGGYFLFQGLNGFFAWVPVPKPQPLLAQFLSSWASLPALMRGAKCLQILCGLLLLINQSTGLALIALGGLVFGITQLQWHLNQNRKLAAGIGLSYLVTLVLHLSEIWVLIKV